MPISSDMYALTPCDVVVMYPRVYIYVSGQKIPLPLLLYSHTD